MNSAELRDRYATTLVYLQDVQEGGETIFTELGVTVRPKQGRLLLWNNMNRNDGTCDPTSFHKAAPVTKGWKFILQRWYVVYLYFYVDINHCFYKFMMKQTANF